MTTRHDNRRKNMDHSRPFRRLLQTGAVALVVTSGFVLDMGNPPPDTVPLLAPRAAWAADGYAPNKKCSAASGCYESVADALGGLCIWEFGKTRSVTAWGACGGWTIWLCSTT
ncbi:MAG: hypothetical protein AB1505_29965 [Candidatus Latescibacterota bacterium]